jgi:hypothetical protein
MSWPSGRLSWAPWSSSFSYSARGNDAGVGGVFKDMTLTEIHEKIEQTSERRTELWRILSQGYDAAAAQELKSLSERLDHLWDEERTLRAELAFGDRDHIVARARVEERLERAA